MGTQYSATEWVSILLPILLFTLPAFVILWKKHRGAGYYILAFLSPLIGLIFSLCLAQLKPKQQNLYPARGNDEKSGIGEKEEFTDAPQSQISKTRIIVEAILCGLFLLIFGTYFIRSYTMTISEEWNKYIANELNIEHIKAKNPEQQENWNTFQIANAFRISIPSTMELRKDYDQYTQLLRNRFFYVNNNDAVFQQANLSNLSDDAYQTYSRILISYFKLLPKDVLSHNQSPDINAFINEFRGLVDNERGFCDFVEEPTYKWIDISGTMVLVAKYSRKGMEGPVSCAIYLLQNYDEMVKIVVSYRETDAELWQTDLDDVIKTFAWNTLK